MALRRIILDSANAIVRAEVKDQKELTQHAEILSSVLLTAPQGGYERKVAEDTRHERKAVADLWQTAIEKLPRDGKGSADRERYTRFERILRAEPLETKTGFPEGDDGDETARQFGEFRYFRDFLSQNKTLKNQLNAYLEGRFSLRELQVQLRRYLLLISYSTYYKHHFEVEAEYLSHRANLAGAITGEGTGTVFRLGDLMSVFPGKYVAFVHNMQTFFGPISYFLYGVGALLSVPQKIRNAYKKINRVDKAIPLPHNYSTSNLLSAFANVSVFLIYLTAAFVFAGSGLAFLGPVGPYLVSWGGWSIGAAGTIVGWLGNNVIDRWRTKHEYDRLTDIQKSFPSIEILVTPKKKEYEDEDYHMWLGVLMVAGMALYAWASLLPVTAAIVPFLPVSVTWPTLLGTVCFVTYAKDGIAHVVKEMYKNKIWMALGLGFLLWAASLPVTAPTVSFLPWVSLTWPGFLGVTSLLIAYQKDNIVSGLKWIGNKICCCGSRNDALDDGGPSSENRKPGGQPYKVLSSAKKPSGQPELDKRPPATAPGYVPPTGSSRISSFAGNGHYSLGFRYASAGDDRSLNLGGPTITPSAPPENRQSPSF